MIKARFCPQCGARLARRLVADRERSVCDRCGYVHYVNPVVAAGTLVERQNRVLLIRRGVEPGLNQWGLPAGYAEAGETPEETAIRETREETGLAVQIDSFLGVYPFSGETAVGGVLILYSARTVDGEPRAGADATEARFFGPDELPADIAFPLHRRVLGQWARAATITCRRAGAPDLENVSTLLQRGSLAGTDKASTLLRDPLSLAILALEQDIPVGILTEQIDPALQESVVECIYVLPAYRRWGIGSRLLARAGSIARDGGVTHLVARVTADNPALLLFTHAGFQVRSVEPGGAGLLSLSWDLQS